MPTSAIDVTAEFRWKTLGMKKALMRRVKKNLADVWVGYPEGLRHFKATYDKEDGTKSVDVDDKDCDELARSLHYGSAFRPPMPFLEDGIRDNWWQIKQNIVEAAFGRESWDTVGEVAVDSIRHYVRMDAYLPKARKAKDENGESYSQIPLIDGGDLMDSLDYYILDQGTEVKSSIFRENEKWLESMEM